MVKLFMKSPLRVDENGFTLIEALLVLSIIMIISSISLLQLRPLHESKKMDQFLEQLQNDIFLSQQYAISHSEPTKLYFSPSESFYRLTRGNSYEVIFLRKVDPDIQIQLISLGANVVFTSNGNIQRSGEIRFRYKESTYIVMFLLGKGRFYVTKR
ncbi:competence type IV pilus minor pilin ComGD [Bacillus sp. JJ1566]|uniref:competence type IV pilus minor pilin ComGD n=1 Tax=Bacillus sp. JJ1566 TaxID=3122961 RepID=UPI002FFDE716